MENNEGFLKTLTLCACAYNLRAYESVKRNSHMNNGADISYVSQDVIDAILVDFINYVASRHNIDYGLYTKDLK